jgi:hypothetical protein
MATAQQHVIPGSHPHVAQLARSSRNGLSVLVGGWDLLADARRRCQALGATVDPLYDVRKMQQVRIGSTVFGTSSSSPHALWSGAFRAGLSTGV